MVSMKFIRPCKLKNSKLIKLKQRNAIIKMKYDKQNSKVINLWNWNIVVKNITGLLNLGNSSYINASLQCIIHATPFYNFCLQREHIRNCIKKNFCSFCLMEKIINYIYLNNNFTTKREFDEFQNISSKIKINQPKPHEFIQALLFSMHDCSLFGFKEKLKFNRVVEYTTPIYRFWGSILRSTFQCCNCSSIHQVDKPILGLSLYIKKNSLHETLEKYFQINNLSEKKKYCKNCKKKRSSFRKITFLKSPLILYIHLKQFKFNHLTKRPRISKLLPFELVLDISKFLFKYPKLPVLYDLFSVLINSENCNKSYYSYCKPFSRHSKTWYCIKDLEIFRVSTKTVINSKAFIICYQKEYPIVCNNSVKVIPKTKIKQSKTKIKKLKDYNGLRSDFLVQLRVKLLHFDKDKSIIKK